MLKRIFTKNTKASTMSRGYPAFTLAEILITLGIIGIVAAMTIPTLLNNTDKKDSYTALQKAISVISQVATEIRTENGNSMANLATNQIEFQKLFTPYMKTVNVCINQTDSANCYIQNTETISNLQGGAFGGVTNMFSTYPKVTTQDGFVYIFYLLKPDCTNDKYQRSGNNELCGQIIVDINGKKLPNTVGKDLFYISINKYNVTPYTNMSAPPIDGRCILPTTEDYNGVDCAHRAIVEGGIYYY